MHRPPFVCGIQTAVFGAAVSDPASLRIYLTLKHNAVYFWLTNILIDL